MSSLPFSVGRFQSEGGEHANYQHNRFYFQHTTRHGGRQKLDPILATLNNTYKQILYAIESDTSVDGQLAYTKFCTYRDQHMAACFLQKHMRGWFVRRRLNQFGWKLGPKSDAELEQTRNAAVRQLASGPEVSATINESKPIFSSMSLILCGAMPKFGKRKVSQADVKSMVEDHGGRVKGKLPGGKSSKKKYIILTEKIPTGKIPATIRQAVRLGHDVLSYKFVQDCIAKGEVVDKDGYRIDVRRVKALVTKPAPMERAYFCRGKTLIYIVKGPRRKIFTAGMNRQKHKSACKHVFQHYAIKRRREYSRLHKIDFRTGSKLFSQYCKEFYSLPKEEQKRHHELWKHEVEAIKLHNQQQTDAKEHLASYNKLGKPAYDNILAFKSSCTNDQSGLPVSPLGSVGR